jgi:Ser/Thr protein kinase RdoA (MazF antagonist)
MANTITFYQEHFHLQDATFSRIEHEDAIVAIVYKITQPNGAQLILKICERSNDYLREVYFLKYFAGKLPIPRVIQVIEPEANVHGAILMEYLPGGLLKKKDLKDALAYEIGSLLAQIHLNRTTGYGDLIQPNSLTSDPRVHFVLKFEESLAECSNHLPQALIDQCRNYYNAHLKLLDSVDGPCMIHRDFRPGNLIIHKGKLQGIIDWSSARASFAEDDFCPLEHGEWSIHPTIKASFLAGYPNIRPVPDYRELMLLLQLSRAIATIGFTVKRETWKSSSASLYETNRQFLNTFFLNSGYTQTT